MWRNNLSNQANHLRVKLVGNDNINRDALGARIEVVADGKTQVRYTRTGSSYLSQSEITSTFGLGTASKADTLRVFWPNGEEMVMENVEAGQELVIEAESAAS